MLQTLKNGSDLSF